MCTEDNSNSEYELNSFLDNFSSEDDLKSLIDDLSSEDDLKGLIDNLSSEDDLKSLIDNLSSEDDLNHDIDLIFQDISSENNSNDSSFATNLIDSEEIKEEVIQVNKNATIKDVANWLFNEVKNKGQLYQNNAAFHVKTHFGDKFVYENKNGNLAINKEVLKVFLLISIKDVVWIRREFKWRLRLPDDPQTGRLIKD
jgi:hypothetical protein